MCCLLQSLQSLLSLRFAGAILITFLNLIVYWSTPNTYHLWLAGVLVVVVLSLLAYWLDPATHYYVNKIRQSYSTSHSAHTSNILLQETKRQLSRFLHTDIIPIIISYTQQIELIYLRSFPLAKDVNHSPSTVTFDKKNIYIGFYESDCIVIYDRNTGQLKKRIAEIRKPCSIIIFKQKLIVLGQKTFRGVNPLHRHIEYTKAYEKTLYEFTTEGELIKTHKIKGFRTRAHALFVVNYQTHQTHQTQHAYQTPHVTQTNQTKQINKAKQTKQTLYYLTNEGFYLLEEGRIDGKLILLLPMQKILELPAGRGGGSGGSGSGGDGYGTNATTFSSKSIYCYDPMYVLDYPELFIYEHCLTTQYQAHYQDFTGLQAAEVSTHILKTYDIDTEEYTESPVQHLKVFVVDGSQIITADYGYNLSIIDRHTKKTLTRISYMSLFESGFWSGLSSVQTMVVDKDSNELIVCLDDRVIFFR